MILKFLKYILFIITSIFILVYGIELLIKKGLKMQQNDFFATMNHVVDGSENHGIIALGASRTKNNISTLVLDSIKKVNSYNAGMYAFGLIETKMMLMCYLQSHHPKPEIVLLTMPDNLARPPSEIGYPAQFYPYLHNDIISNTLNKYDSNIKLLKRFPFLALMKYDDHIKYVAMIPFLKPRHAKSNLFKGYEALDGTLKDPSKFKKATLAKEVFKNADKEQLSYFYDLCNYSYHNKIKMIIILTPTFQTSLDSLPNPMAVFLNSKQDVLHFKLLDFTSDSICLNPSLFYDRQHLNTKGSKIFTIKVAESF